MDKLKPEFYEFLGSLLLKIENKNLTTDLLININKLLIDLFDKNKNSNKNDLNKYFSIL